MKNVAVIIPTKNEEEGIGNVIDSIPKARISGIFVIDGCSKDRTAAIAKEKGANVITEPRRGYGRAYKTGFKSIPEKAEIIACIDGDGTYPAGMIEKLAETLDDEGLDFISCSRTYDKSMSGIHKIGNRALTILANMLFGTHLKDSQSGMWVFRKSVLDSLNLESDGMGFSEELKIRVIKNGLRFREIPVKYGERLGEAKLRTLEDGVKNALFLLKLRSEFYARTATGKS